MGWMLKILAFLLALFAFSLGAWIVGVPILLLLFLPLFRRDKHPERRDYYRERAPVPVAKSHASARYWIAGVFFVLAIAATASGGSLSPFVLTSLGMVTLLWGRMKGSSLISSVKSLHESVVLCAPVPLVYFAVAELKLTTKEVGRVLSSLNGHLLIMGGEKPSVFVVLQCFTLGTKHAEKRFAERLRALVNLAVPLGAYPLPLDGEQVASVLKDRDRLKLKTKNLLPSLASAPLQALSVVVGDGVVKSIGAYGKVRGQGTSILPATQSVEQVVFWEVVKELGGKIAWPNPDQHSAFLESLFATRGAPLGERVIDAGSSGTSTVLVRSSGSQPVELSRAQLRSLVTVYE